MIDRVLGQAAAFLYSLDVQCSAQPLRGSLPVSDHGIDGAVPLPPPTWDPWTDPLSGSEWAEQNRKINDLLAGRMSGVE